MAQKLRLRRGVFGSLPTTGLEIGEPLWTTDRNTLHVADTATTHKPATPAMDSLVALTTVDGANDLLLIHDASQATGQKEKKITFANLKTALNIPDASTDQLVAVADGGTAGYLFNTNGSDGVLRAGASLSYINTTNAYVTFDVADNGITGVKIVDSAVVANKIASSAVTEAKIAGGAVTEAKIGTGAVTNAKLAATALNLGSVFSNNGITTALTIANSGITNAMLAAAALNLNAITFSGNGITTELDIAVIDGGTF